MLSDTPWTLDSNSKGRSWSYNGGKSIGLLDRTVDEERELIQEYDTDDRWVLAGPNSIITTFDGTEDEAIEKAKEWLLEHADSGPSGMH